MFNEAWNQIARERIWLRPALQIRRQIFRGERWHVIHDPFSNRFVRFSPAAYAFLVRLTKERTVGEVWEACHELNPAEAPTQEEAVQLLTQLHQASLLQSDVSPDARELFERRRRLVTREVRSKLGSLLFVRIPLWDPEAFLRRSYPVVAPLFSKPMAVVWLAVVAWSLKVLADNWDAAVDKSEQLLAPGNLPLLLVTFFAIKFIHEMGHAYAVKKFGGEVHSMGIMLLVFSPVPFVDATSAWAFRERWKRVFVGAAGMIVELFIAAIAVTVWANTGSGLVHGLAYNAMVIASVTTILFNINPLLRFDGYYILSDLVDTPNLQPRSLQQLVYLGERYLFGIKTAFSPARSPREGAWLAVFGIASFIYRLFIFSVIILFVADKFFGLGLIAAALALLGMFVLPFLKFSRYLAGSPRLRKCRGRAVAVTAGIAGAAALLLGVIPVPDHIRAPGMIRAVERARITANVTGHVRKLNLPSVNRVEKGSALLALESRELEFSIAAAEAQYRQVEALGDLAQSEIAASIVPVEKRKETVRRQLEQLEKDRESLAVRATMDGLWISPRLAEFDGVRVERGTVLGEVIDPSRFEFVAVVSQEDASNFFENRVSGAEVRIPGQAGETLEVARIRIVPSQQEALPSPALGWLGGGPVKVAADDVSGLRAAEPFFLVVADLSPDSEAGAEGLLHKRTGRIRFDLPREPLLRQWTHDFRQLLQRRFQL